MRASFSHRLMNHPSLRSFSLLLTGLSLAACGGGGGGGRTTATVSGDLRVPQTAPARLDRQFDLRQPMRPGEVVVWLDGGAAAAADLAVDGFELVRSGGPIAVYRAAAAAGRSSLRDGASEQDSVERATCDAATAMQARDGVRAASPNWLLQPCIEPNDTHFDKQWHYPQINLPQAWDVQQGSTNVIVAVLDTGIVSAHPEFTGRLIPGFDMISDPTAAGDGGGRDANPEDEGDFATPQGSSFHGTHVAGTIGANGNDGSGIAGVDWNCKLMIVRVLGRGGGSVDDIANGILFAAGLANGTGQVPAQPADIINMSLGGPGLSAVLEQACDAAANAGVLLVAAAGNDDSDQPNSPAAFASVMSVGATDLVRARAPYSNFNTTIDIWAPGGDMTADRNGDQFPDGVLSCMADDQGALFFKFENGTSMASPHVAGVAALVKAADPALTAAQIRAVLINTTAAGAGLPNGGRLLDAQAAVTFAAGGSSVPLLVATPATVDFGTTQTTANVVLENRGSGNLAFQSATVNPTATWLQVATSDVVASNGLDRDSLDLTVDRTGLPDGVLQTTVTLGYLDGGTPASIDIEVRAQVGASSNPTDTVFVLLVDPITLETRFQTSTTPAANFAYAFGLIPPGDYILVAGTDRDLDDLLGDDGELFGAWPNLDDPQALSVAAGVDATGLEFSLQELVTVSSAPSAPVARRTFRRLP